MEEQQHLFELQIDAESQAALTDGAKWAKFLSIVGFIFCGLLFIMAIAIGTILSATGAEASMVYTSGIRAGITLLYIALSVVYFFPCLFLFKYARKIKDAIETSDQEVMGKGFHHLKMLFKYMGILMIIGLAVFAIVLIFAIATTMMAAHY